MDRVFPDVGRLAGIDFGTVRIGVAITDSERTIASPYENYTRRNEAKDQLYFQQLAHDERLVGFVVGLPVHTSGEESQKSQEARAFGRWLNEITSLPVRFYDERYTSVQAEQFLLDAQLTKKRRKKRLDMIAAQIMLSAFIESGKTQHPGALDD